MRNITKIDTAKSIILRRLVFHEEWIDKIDRILIYIVFGVSVVLPTFMILKADFNNPNNRLISLTVFPLTILLSLYILYRTATEKFLIELTTQFDSEKNKQLLLAFADKQQLIVGRNSKDNIILYNKFYTKNIVFIINDNLVLFTILRNGYRINLPTLISHLLLKRKLKIEYNISSFDS